ncbi:MAG: hypothetical protein U0350_21090 [Caldilineaceae bacterium]
MKVILWLQIGLVQHLAVYTPSALCFCLVLAILHGSSAKTFFPSCFTGYMADHASLATGLRFLRVPPLIGILWAVGYRLFVNKHARV